MRGVLALLVGFESDSVTRKGLEPNLSILDASAGAKTMMSPVGSTPVVLARDTQI